MKSALLYLVIILPNLLRAQSLSESIGFFGQWDRRQPECAITVNSGSYIKARFVGTGITATFDMKDNQPPMPTIVWKIDDGVWQESEIAPRVILAEKLSSGSHDLILMARGMDEHQSRWESPLVAKVALSGLVPTDGKFLDLPKEKGPKLEFLGDSITEGVYVHGEHRDTTPWSWMTDARLSYAGIAAMELQAQWRQVGFGRQGILREGNGGVPSAPESFDYFYKDCPRDNWQPDAVIINQGTNDGGAKPEEFKQAYHAYLERIRSAYPKARIIALVPFCGAHKESIQEVIWELNDRVNRRFYGIDASHWLGREDYTDELHPNVRGGEKAGKRLSEELRRILAL